MFTRLEIPEPGVIDPPIRTPRALIRRFEHGDLEPFLAFMLDPESTKHLLFDDGQKTDAGARALFDFVRAAYDSDAPVHSYAVADAATEQYVGSCGFAPYDVGVVEVYYGINRAFRGNGIATEVTVALARALSRTHEVRAYCSPENTAAHAVALNSGFEAKGRAVHKQFNVEGLLFVRRRGESPNH